MMELTFAAGKSKKLWTRRQYRGPLSFSSPKSLKRQFQHLARDARMRASMHLGRLSTLVRAKTYLAITW